MGFLFFSFIGSENSDYSGEIGRGYLSPSGRFLTRLKGGGEGGGGPQLNKMGRLRGIHEGERQKTSNLLGVLISQLSQVQLNRPPLSRMKYFREIAFTRSLFPCVSVVTCISSHSSPPNFKSREIIQEKFINERSFKGRKKKKLSNIRSLKNKIEHLARNSKSQS